MKLARVILTAAACLAVVLAIDAAAVAQCSGQGNATLVMKGNCDLVSTLKFRYGGAPFARYCVMTTFGSGPTEVPGVGTFCLDFGNGKQTVDAGRFRGRGVAASFWTLPDDPALIGEEVFRDGRTLRQIVEDLADVVEARAERGLRHGVCLIPEGLIEFVPEMRALIEELNRLLSEKSANIETISTMEGKRAFVVERLSESAGELFAFLPKRIEDQLLLDRDSHGNVQVSKIDTEQMLSEQVRGVLAERGFGKWQVQHHFFGYEGRCAAPTNFDADYTYALGSVAAALVAFGKSGYLAAVGDLAGRPEHRRALGVPLTSLMQIEERKGRPTPVIGKALVDLDGAPFAAFARAREAWAAADHYRYPGPIQYFGPDEVCGGVSETLALESER